jgi:hypothetical protein
VVADGQPVVGLFFYAVSEDRSTLIVQSSTLTRHSKDLVAKTA